MSPEYFRTRLTFQEADDYLYGLNRRYHATWECARWQTTFIAKCAGNKNYSAPEFYWEKRHSKANQMTLDELKRMRQAGAAFAARMNKEHGKG